MELTSYILAALAGALTTLSPCVLPVLPLVLSSALRSGRRGPLLFATGLLISFVGLTWVLARFGSLLGLGPEGLRLLSAALLVVAGVWMLSERAQEKVSALMASRLCGLERASRQLEAGTLGLGLLTGLLWTPCSGPSLGVALGLAAERETALQSLLLLLVFGLGALLPLMIVAYGSRGLAERLRGAAASRLKKVLGALVALVGLLVLTGADRKIEAWLLGLSPDWLTDWTTKF
jgi:cytochrome c-type biogenesis protein